MKRLLISAVLLLVCVGSYAQRHKKEPLHPWDVLMASPEAITEAKKYKGSCGNAVVQPVMNACYAQEAEESQRDLNKVYRETLVKLQSPERAKLRQVQTAWTKYRDLQCKAARDENGPGSIQPTIFSSCLADLNRQRMKELRETYQAQP